MKTLSKSQIEQLRVLLADYGLDVKPKPKVNPKRDPNRVLWPFGPAIPGAPRFKSRTYGHMVGTSTAARISPAEFAEIKKRSGDMFA